jgi:hypothetical protein
MVLNVVGDNPVMETTAPVFKLWADGVTTVTLLAVSRLIVADVMVVNAVAVVVNTVVGSGRPRS